MSLDQATAPYEPGWLNEEEIAARGMCAAFHGAADCGCMPATCRAIGFSTLAKAGVEALRASNRLITAPEPQR